MKLFRFFRKRSGDTSPPPEEREESVKGVEREYEPRFLEFIRLFATIGKDGNLFPKVCNTCGIEYESFSEYLHNTTPVGHALEDCTNVMDVPYTMQYRNCPCGSTLVLVLTDETFPVLERFWQTLKEVAEESGRPLKEVVNQFRDQCNQYVIDSYLAREEGDG